jgi:hypothetical protein
VGRISFGCVCASRTGYGGAVFSGGQSRKGEKTNIGMDRALEGRIGAKDRQCAGLGPKKELRSKT